MTDTFRRTLIAVLLATLLVVAAVVLISSLYRGDTRLLQDVTFSENTITPNADGNTDATIISYALSRDARVSIYFEGNAGERYYFRENNLRGRDSYSVGFSGIVEGFLLPGEQFDNEVLERLMPSGDYTWHVVAEDLNGQTDEWSDTFTVSEADTELPIMAGFELERDTFTPNRDGVDDRVKIQFDLKKEVEVLRVYLLTDDGAEYEIQELPRNAPRKRLGDIFFDYEGGVDLNATPPEDGTYTIVAFAQDAEGQKMRVTEPLTLQFGGVPRAEIVSPISADTFEVNTTALALCDTMFFTATVRNYGTVPIRTTGPESGAVYDSDWNYNTVGWNTESGAFRFAVGYEDETRNYAYRWALGTFEQLTLIGEHYYLMPGQQVVVNGGIRMTNELGRRNPQPMWAGLIHEDVAISQGNDRVNPKAVEIDYPPADRWVDCAPREIPVRGE